MTDYVPINNWAAKDAAADPILASEHNSEYGSLQTHIQSKEDASNKGVANGYCPLTSASEVGSAFINFGLVAATVAEGDHIHSTAGGNSTAALSLENPRDIGGVSFDGTANIDPTDVDIAVAGVGQHFIGIFDGQTGARRPKTDASLSFDTTTNTLTTGIFAGSLTGTATDAAQATKLTTARNIGNVSFNGTANITPTHINPALTSSTTCFPALFDSTTGAQQVLTDAGLTYNASTNKMTCTDFIATSDIALKENIVPLNSALNTLAQIGTYFYDRIDSGERHAGVLAQEVQRVLPNAVEGVEGRLAVSTQQLLSVVISAVNELSRKLDART